MLIKYQYFSDINECDTSTSPTGKCGANALCSNSPGGFSCTCQPGFTGDPFVNCYGKPTTYNIIVMIFRKENLTSKIFCTFLIHSSF